MLPVFHMSRDTCALVILLNMVTAFSAMRLSTVAKCSESPTWRAAHNATRVPHVARGMRVGHFVEHGIGILRNAAFHDSKMQRGIYASRTMLPVFHMLREACVLVILLSTA